MASCSGAAIVFTFFFGGAFIVDIDGIDMLEAVSFARNDVVNFAIYSSLFSSYLQAKLRCEWFLF
jgi:hypothetical protein